LKKTINSDLIRGNIDTIILKALAEGDRYGFDIVKEIEQKSSGQYVLKQPTLYSCLKRLETKGFIRSYWGAKSVGGRRKYYTLTDLGRELFTNYQTEWEYSRTVIDKLISDREYDLSSLGGLEAPIAPPEGDVVGDDDNDDTDDNSSGFNNIDEYIDNDVDEESDDNSDDDHNNSENKESSGTKEFICPFASMQNEEHTALKEFYEEVISKDDDNYNNSSNSNSNNNLEASDEKSDKTDEYIEESNSVDTAAIFNELLVGDGAGNSYSDNLNQENYLPETKKAPPTFSDIETIGEFVDESQDSFESGDGEVNGGEDEAYDYPTPASTTTSEPSNPPTSFISYHTRNTTTTDEHRSVLERDYKNVLSKLVTDQSTAVPEAAPIARESAVIPVSDEMAHNHALMEARYATNPLPVHLASQGETAPEPQSDEYDRLTVSMRDLGDDITIRRHDIVEMREHAQ